LVCNTWTVDGGLTNWS